MSKRRNAKMKDRTFAELLDAWTALPDPMAENAAAYFMGCLSIQIEANPQARITAARDALASAMEKFGR